MGVVVKSLWVGPTRFSKMERLTAISHLAQGHELQLFTYGPVEGVPEGVVVRDAREILPESAIFVYQVGKSKGGYGGFSNVFRYEMLLAEGGFWIDMDLVALRPFDFEGEYVISSEIRGPGLFLRPNCGAMKLPKGCAMAADAVAACRAQDRSRLGHGQSGPDLVSQLVLAHGLERFVTPYFTFCPIHWYDHARLVTGEGRDLEEEAAADLGEAYAIHLWNELFRRSWVDKDADFPPHALFEKLKRRYGV